MLEKDDTLRLKEMKHIMKHPWLKNVNMQDVLAKKMEPPFKTEMFENNFDSSDFQNDEEKEMLKLERDKEKFNLDSSEIAFPNFLYFCEELQELEINLAKNV
jgi:hypothetical protein